MVKQFTNQLALLAVLNNWTQAGLQIASNVRRGCYAVAPCCKLKDLTKKMQESLSSSTLGVESEKQSCHWKTVYRCHIILPANAYTQIPTRTSSYTCKCVRADPHTQAGVGCRGELVAEFVLLGFYGTGIKTYTDAGFLAVNSISNY